MEREKIRFERQARSRRPWPSRKRNLGDVPFTFPYGRAERSTEHGSYSYGPNSRPSLFLFLSSTSPPSPPFFPKPQPLFMVLNLYFAWRWLWVFLSLSNGCELFICDCLSNAAYFLFCVCGLQWRSSSAVGRTWISWLMEWCKRWFLKLIVHGISFTNLPYVLVLIGKQ